MMNSCMQKVQAVSFEEQVSLYGVATAVPHSSGLSIGIALSVYDWNDSLSKYFPSS